MFREIILPIFRSTRLCVNACGIIHPRCCRPATGYVLCSRFFPLIHWFFSFSSFVIPSKCLKNFICAASKRCSPLFLSTQASLPNFNAALAVMLWILIFVSLFIFFSKMSPYSSVYFNPWQQNVSRCIPICSKPTLYLLHKFLHWTALHIHHAFYNTNSCLSLLLTSFHSVSPIWMRVHINNKRHKEFT